ncbi:carboxylate-amine ligase [Actinomadura alba]|uniref:Putative glutamate--cysteine ligase 2 n=1 Tax=Actinomadura alba TaxID=406431 RepID=A0ABR7LRU9_9ACTN|nr:glutamate--cysteine ligase [Actinomadura alba]MBC6467554.1 glutamate--cysteine ligase [Actinomadura alba]
MNADDRARRFGVEEEFLVIDRRTRATAASSRTILDHARQELGDRVGGEITKIQVESRTTPCTTTAELTGQLLENRATLAAKAAEAGLGIIASGTPVLDTPIPSPITEGPRQDRGNATFRGLHHELDLCALHVHVELPDREQAVLMSNHLRPHLPTLIALAANSPFWRELDTGYDSWRTLMWNRWPVAGPPPYFNSAAHYDELVATLLEAEALVDDGTIFWDVRPSARLPTLEVRATDVPITAEESAALAALVRALVVSLLPAVEGGDPGPELRPELMRLAYWRAARDGLAGSGIDVRTGRPVLAADLARRLLETARPGLEEHGDLGRVTDWLGRLTEHGNGATRQRRAARDGRLTDVVDHLMEQTAPVPQGSKTQ